MLSLVLAATVIATPATVEEGCDPQKLTALTTVQKTDRIAAEMELDRRIAATLAEERKAGAAAAEALENAKAAEAKAHKTVWGALALALLGLGVAGVGVLRRSTGIMSVGMSLAACAGMWAFSISSTPYSAQVAAREATAKQLALTQCRFRVTDARMQMMQSRIAGCTHDMDEADEDIWAWVTRLEGQQPQPVTAEMLKKLHGELRESLRY